MSTKRLTRVNELLRREIAELVLRTLTNHDVDGSSATVTHVITSSDLRSARVLVSVLGDAAMQESVLNHLRENRARIQSAMSRHVILKYTPKLTFQLDDSLQQGDRILRLIEEMEHAEEEVAGGDQCTEG